MLSQAFCALPSSFSSDESEDESEKQQIVKQFQCKLQSHNKA